MEDVIKNFMQIGGDETLGRGICKIHWIAGGAK
jgi:CRISPR-associated protein Cmr4